MNELTERTPAQHVRRWIRSLNPEQQTITWSSDVLAGVMWATISTQLDGQPFTVKVEVTADVQRHSE